MQGDLFEDGSWEPSSRKDDPATSKESEQEVTSSGRRRKQCLQILDRLKDGPATARELNEIALSYGRRISDLRQQGYEVKCLRKKEKPNVFILLEQDDLDSSRQRCVKREG